MKEEERARKKAEKDEKRAARGSAVIAPRVDTGSGSARPDEAERQEGFSPGKVKSWLRSKLTRQKPTAKDRDSSELGRGFVGGHVLLSPEPGTEDSAAASPTPTGEPGTIRKPSNSHTGEERAQTPVRGESEEPPQTPLERGVSPGSGDSFEDARENPTPQMTPPRMIGAVNPAASPSRDSRFVEMMD